MQTLRPRFPLALFPSLSLIDEYDGAYVCLHTVQVVWRYSLLYTVMPIKQRLIKYLLSHLKGDSACTAVLYTLCLFAVCLLE